MQRLSSCPWHSGSITCGEGVRVKRRWLLGQDKALGSVSVVSRLCSAVSPPGKHKICRRGWAVGAEPGWAQPRGVGHCSLPGAAARDSSRAHSRNGALRETLDDCASSQRFFIYF